MLELQQLLKFRPYRLHPSLSQPAVLNAPNQATHQERGEAVVLQKEQSSCYLEHSVWVVLLLETCMTLGTSWGFSEAHSAHLWSVVRVPTPEFVWQRLWITSHSTHWTPSNLHSAPQAQLHFWHSLPARVQSCDIMPFMYAQLHKCPHKEQHEMVATVRADLLTTKVAGTSGSGAAG